MTAMASFVTLVGQYVSLVPLSLAHHDDLVEATGDGALWRLWYTSVPSPEGMRDEIARRLEQQERGTMLPFAVMHNGLRRAVGMTTYLNIDSVNRRVEIGATWYRQSVQRTAINTEAKLLLLGHAFDTLGCIAVEFRTHFHNRQSRAGIERLGAKLDGILRNHQRNLHPDAAGSYRDTCVYSILPSEWPAVRANLLHRLRLAAAQ
jgi:RimJ/RimL family protein N-acetyltransferase